jgi:hypothetical protein
MKERAVKFGAEGNLVGILTEPDGAVPGRPAVLLYNVGFGHRVGPHRLNVELSRELAARGFVSLRFDLSGLGDSDPRVAPGEPVERAAADLEEAMAYLSRRRGLERFALVAMCSGVDVGHVVATREPRILAAAFLDGYAYVTAGYRLRSALARLRQPRAAFRKLLRALRPAPPPAAGQGGGATFYDREYPSREAFVRDVLGMSGRGTQLLYLFSFGWWYFNHVGQFAAMLGRRRLPPGLQVEYWIDADHMYTAVGARARLVLRLAGWVEGCFPGDLGEVRHRVSQGVA